jgi:molybdate transport system substrate-binding protein
VRYSLAGSDILAAQIRAGARPDVYAAANTTLPDALYSVDYLVGEPIRFASNELVLATQADNTRTRSTRPRQRRRRADAWDAGALR